MLEVRGNDNLLELWTPPENDSSAGLHVVSEGLVHFILNRNLCPKRVFELLDSGALSLPSGRNFKREELELATRTNGKMAFCKLPHIFSLFWLLEISLIVCICKVLLIFCANSKENNDNEMQYV